MRIITGTVRPTSTQWLPVLSNIAPPGLRRKVACDKLMEKITNNPALPVYNDVFNHPEQRLMSRHPIWTDLDPIDICSRWREEWLSAKVFNCFIVDDPATRVPGFDLPRCRWSLLNRFRTGQGPCRASRHRWGHGNTSTCDCGLTQTMNHLVEDCPLHKFPGACRRSMLLTNLQAIG